MSELRAEHLAKRYKSRTVVKDLSLKIGSGEVVGILGPNGAGKTTAFYMLVGLVACDAGRIFIDDQDISGLPIQYAPDWAWDILGSISVPQFDVETPRRAGAAQELDKTQRSSS
jgi:ABC-type cobalamin/Fe3+-siderophores transport system ATPase subunit